MTKPGEAQLAVRFVRLSPETVPAVLALERKCFSDPWPEVELRRLAEAPESGESFRQLVTAALTPDGRVAGYACVYLVAGEAQLLRIAADPALRRLGIGAALLAFVTEEASSLGAERTTLEVRESNAAARALYEKAGFTVDGVRNNFYDAPRENAVLMSRGCGGTRLF